MVDERLLRDLSFSPPRVYNPKKYWSRGMIEWDSTKPEELVGLEIERASPFIAGISKNDYAPARNLNPRSWVHLLRKARGILPRFKVSHIPYKRRSYGYELS